MNNLVKKFMDKFNKPVTHENKKKKAKKQLTKEDKEAILAPRNKFGLVR